MFELLPWPHCSIRKLPKGPLKIVGVEVMSLSGMCEEQDL